MITIFIVSSLPYQLDLPLAAASASTAAISPMQNQMQSAKSVGNGKTSIQKKRKTKCKKIQKASRQQSRTKQNAEKSARPLVWGRWAANLRAVKANTTLAAKKFRAFVFVSVFVRGLLLSLYVCASGCVCVSVCVREQKFPFLNFLHTIFCAFFRAHRRLQTSPIPN